MVLEKGKQKPEGRGTLEFAIDSGAEAHVSPLKLMTPDMLWIRGPRLSLRGASGDPIQHYGTAKLLMEMNGTLVEITAEVVEVRRPLLSVAAMLDAGWFANFGKQPNITKDDVVLPLERRGGLFILEGVRRRTQEAENREVMVMPLEHAPEDEAEEQEVPGAALQEGWCPKAAQESPASGAGTHRWSPTQRKEACKAG